VAVAPVCLFAVWAFLFAIGRFSIYAMTDTLVLEALWLGGFGGLFGGLVYGAISCHSPPLRSADTTTACETPTQMPTERVPGPSFRAQPWRIGNGLLAFIAGLLVAVGITISAGWIASLFRGPIVVIGVFHAGTPGSTGLQEAINLTAGFGIAMAGWIGGVLLLRRRVWVGFSLGLLVGTTLLGILFACQ
jgi:hypothetical protein